MINRSPIALALALTAGLAGAIAAAPDHRMGHGRMRPGMFPGITFEANDDPAPPAPGGFEAKTLGEVKTIFVQLRDQIGDLTTATQEQKNNLAAVQEQMSKLEVEFHGNRPTPGKPGAKAGEVDVEQKAFDLAMRKGLDKLKPDEAKLLSTDSDSDGGFTVPVNVDRNIRERLIEISPIRELATVVTISQGDTIEIPMEDETTDVGYGWVAEREARTETGTPKLRMVKITAHEMFAEPRITQKLLDDSAYNVEAWLSGRVTKQLALAEGGAFINGNGDGKPLGLLDAASGISYVAGGDATLITAAGLMNLIYDLPEMYAKMAKFLMKRSTVGAVRLLKDGEDRFIWQPGLKDDQPGVLLGHDYREAVDMPVIAAGAFPVLFGDFAEAYTVVDRQGVRVLRDPYTAKPFVKFYTTKRTGGAVVVKAAMRKLKIATS